MQNFKQDTKDLNLRQWKPNVVAPHFKNIINNYTDIFNLNNKGCSSNTNFFLDDLAYFQTLDELTFLERTVVLLQAAATDRMQLSTCRPKPKVSCFSPLTFTPLYKSPVLDQSSIGSAHWRPPLRWPHRGNGPKPGTRYLFILFY